ncbi:hypothetical protein A3H16_00695 [Candidatus Kaiserbacteria bacterium RIFCSPLOWO2_12_FULL_53_8]|uniref:Uncharacterized protein n=2 Tax=Candidatus Kaiseribacteriota TaxID=1752734 RepID=A0A1F6CYJ5_9BACT|nr:MAG: hypothetical protein A2851_01080 [Candidatus Kaiserbacteria bacterium RIFCSPHIGHO2_01_FULL_53_29]OGG90768.1 MAG: hypothetical protein A3H16_00695 [Candidatus Kaiserbacteria bacterium RIFCSPLOWO2_12_FULL_53_8]
MAGRSTPTIGVLHLTILQIGNAQGSVLKKVMRLLRRFVWQEMDQVSHSTKTEKELRFLAAME